MLFHPAERIKPKRHDGKAPYSHVEEKLDGWRLTIIKESGRDILALGRNDRNLWHSLSDEVQSLVLGRVPDDTVVDCELVVPGQFATEVPRALKSRDSSMKLVAFAMPILRGLDCRRADIATVREELEEMGLSVPHAFDPSMSPDELRLLAAEEQLEGVVLKEGHWRGWWKVKPFRSVDAVVVSVKPGKGKHAGRNGSLEVAVYESGRTLVAIADVGTGGDEHWRDLPRAQCVGRVVEVSYDEVGAGGRLKFPRFTRWRDDKPREECVDQQLLS